MSRRSLLAAPLVLGLVAVPQDGLAFKAQILKDRERWAAVVKAGNIKAE